jgi:hypothetical protein
MHNVFIASRFARSLSANCNDFVKMREDRFVMKGIMARYNAKTFVHHPWLKLKKLLQFTFSQWELSNLTIDKVVCLVV